MNYATYNNQTYNRTENNYISNGAIQPKDLRG